MSKDIDKAFDTARGFVEQMRDDHRPMAMYTALRAVLDVVEKLKDRPKPEVDPVPTTPPEAGQLPPQPPIEPVDEPPTTPAPTPPKPAKH